MLSVAQILVIGEADIRMAVIDDVQRLDRLHATLQEVGVAAVLAEITDPTSPLNDRPAHSGASGYTKFWFRCAEVESRKSSRDRRQWLETFAVVKVPTCFSHNLVTNALELVVTR